MIYGQLWEKYHVDSLHAYGDYDEASMFSYAAALVVESFYNSEIRGNKKSAKVIYHANEWMTGLGALYINDHLPQIATILQHMQQVSDAVLQATTNLSMNTWKLIMVIKWQPSSIWRANTR